MRDRSELDLENRHNVKMNNEIGRGEGTQKVGKKKGNHILNTYQNVG